MKHLIAAMLALASLASVAGAAPAVDPALAAYTPKSAQMLLPLSAVLVKAELAKLN